MTIEYETFTGHTDETRVRQWKKGNYEFLIKMAEPHGMWSIRKPNGNVPMCLTGKYTSVDYAVAAIEGYINKNGHLMERQKPKEKRQNTKTPDIKSEVKSKKD